MAVNGFQWLSMNPMPIQFPCPASMAEQIRCKKLLRSHGSSAPQTARSSSCKLHKYFARPVSELIPRTWEQLESHDFFVWRIWTWHIHDRPSIAQCFTCFTQIKFQETAWSIPTTLSLPSGKSIIKFLSIACVNCSGELEYLEYTRICPAAHITGISAILSQCLKIAIILPDQGQAIQVVDQTVKPQLPAVPVVHHHFPHSNCMFFSWQIHHGSKSEYHIIVGCIYPFIIIYILFIFHYTIIDHTSPCIQLLWCHGIYSIFVGCYTSHYYWLYNVVHHYIPSHSLLVVIYPFMSHPINHISLHHYRIISIGSTLVSHQLIVSH